MDQNQTLQIFYELAIATGDSFDLRQMLKTSMLTYLKKLNCAAGWIYQLNQQNDGKQSFDIIHSVPRNTVRNEAYTAVTKHIPDNPSARQLAKLNKSLPITGKTKSGNYYYILELANFGLMILVKNDQPLDPILLKSLKPLQDRLASACIACLNQAEIENSLNRRAQQVQLSTAISQEIASAPQLDALFQKVVSLVQQEFGYYHAHLYTVQEITESTTEKRGESGTYLVMQQGTGSAATKMKKAGHKIAFDAEKSLVARSAQTKQPVLVADVSSDPDWLPNPLLPNTKAELAIPIILGDEVLGVLDVQNDKVASLGQEDEILLSGLCGQIAVSINNRRIQDQRQKNITQLEAVNHIVQTAIMQDNIDTLIEEVGQQIIELIDGATSGYVALYDSASNIIEFPYFEDEGQRQNVPSRQLDKGLSALVINNAHPVLINHNTVERIAETGAIIIGEPAKSYLGVPMIVGGEVAGILSVQNLREEGHFNQDDQRLLTTIAGTVGAAIQNRRLLDQTQNALEEANFLRLAIEQSANGSVVADIEGNIIFANHAWASMHGYETATELIGRHLSIFHTPEQLKDEVEPFNAKVLKTGANQASVGHKRKDGSTFSTLMTVALVKDNNGNPLGLAAAAQDISESKAKEDQLAQTTAFLNSILDNIPSGLFVKEAKDLRFVRWNKANEAVIGLKAEDVLGKNDYDLFSKEEADSFVAKDREVLKGGVLVDIPEETISTPHKGNRILHTRKVPIMGPDGEPQFLLGISEDITDDIAKERELKETTNFLNSVLDNIPTMLFVKEAKDLRFVRWNQAGEELLGVPKEELIGKNDYDFFPPEEADFFVAKDREVLERGELLDIPEEPIQTADKGIRFLHTRKVPILDADGEPRYLLGISEDITERKQMEDDLKANQALYESLLDAIPQKLYRIDKQGRVVFGNKAYLQDMGMSLEELVGKTTHDLADPALADKYVADDQMVMETGEVFEIIEEHQELSTGKTNYVQVVKAPVRDSAGEIIGVQGIFWDVTEQKQTELERERLLKDVERLAAIVENHPDFIGVGSLEGQALYVNPAGLKMIGLPPDTDISHMTAADFYLPEDAERLQSEGIPTAIKQGNWTAEAKLLTVDGNFIPVEQTISINRNAQGEPASFSITMRDITARLETEAERERLLEEVETAYRQFVRREWEQYLSQRPENKVRIEYLTGTDIQVNPETKTSQIQAPISIRGQAIGAFRLEDLDPNRRWTNEERALVQAVSEQLALTVENLRLFENTRQRAAREQITRQITDKMRAAPDADSIIQTGLAELTKALGVSRSYVKLNPSSKTANDNNQSKPDPE